MAKKRGNLSRSVALPEIPEIDAKHQRVRSSAMDLTEAERKVLKDPDWIDEDEADAIISMRIDKAEGHKSIPLREYLRQRGIRRGLRPQ